MKEIKLTQGYVALVDVDDFEFLNQFKWHVRDGNGHNKYAIKNISVNNERIACRMHRVIMEAPKGVEVDHIDHNGLNNQKSNLRLCSTSQNAMNRKARGSSKYLGVYIVKIKGKNKTYEYFKAQINTNGKYKSLGYFKSEEIAAKTYDEAAKNYHGEFANLNFKQDE